MASSSTQDNTRKGSVLKLEFNWVADESDGSFVAAVSNIAVNGIVQAIEIVPGTPSPTASYAITLSNDFGRDVLNGAGVDLSATLATAILPNPEGIPLIDSFLTLAITGNSVNSAQGKVIIYALEF